MSRELLIFAMASIVYGQNSCPVYPAFSSLPHIPNDIENKLTGTFLVAYTSATVVNCHRARYNTDENNVITGQVEIPGCCVKTDNYLFNTDELEYDVGPIVGYTNSCPTLGNDRGLMKLLATTGSGNSLCLITAICQTDYFGLYVFCRGTAPPLSDITDLLSNLPVKDLALQAVPQTNCDSNNCPAF